MLFLHYFNFTLIVDFDVMIVLVKFLTILKMGLLHLCSCLVLVLDDFVLRIDFTVEFHLPGQVGVTLFDVLRGQIPHFSVKLVSSCLAFRQQGLVLLHISLKIVSDH